MHLIKQVDNLYITDKQLKSLLKHYLPQVADILGRSVLELQAMWCEYFGIPSLTECTQEQADIIINRCKSVIFSNHIKNNI